MSPMHGIIEVDVTVPYRVLSDSEVSFTAFVIATAGRAAARHPEVHAYRDWRGRVVRHQFVDITTLVEVATDRGPFPLAHLVRDADIRDVEDIGRELQDVKTDPAKSSEGKRLSGFAPLAGRIPGLARSIYWVMAKSTRLRNISGTVVVSAIGMFGGGSGHGIGAPSVQSLSILVGGVSPKPVAQDGEIVIRDVLDLTVTFDHNIVDGAPAARFTADLREMLSSGAGLI